MPDDLWSNGPGAKYAPHAHPYHKSLKCLKGSIEFLIEGKTIRLKAGDMLEVPAGTVHSARVGPEGCTCSEDHRPA